jgi:hypothetical protein
VCCSSWEATVPENIAAGQRPWSELANAEHSEKRRFPRSGLAQCRIPSGGPSSDSGASAHVAVGSSRAARHYAPLPPHGHSLRLQRHALIDHHARSVTVGAELNAWPIAEEAGTLARRAGYFSMLVLVNLALHSNSQIRWRRAILRTPCAGTRLSRRTRSCCVARTGLCYRPFATA